MNPPIALRIKKIREYRNYTQAYMAKELGIKQNTYSKVECGITTLKPARLKKIAKILEVDVDIISGTDMPLFWLESSKNTTTGTMHLIETIENFITVLQKEVRLLKNSGES